MRESDLLRIFGVLLVLMSQIICQILNAMEPSSEDVVESSSSSSDWTYTDIHAWRKISQTCIRGRRQSPIALSRGRLSRLPAISTQHYQTPFRSTPTIKNNGHTVEMEIPTTENGRRPRISGGTLRGIFEAIQLHFHWGAPRVKGSEHAINRRRYDVEMHIVHRNLIYNSTTEASQHPNGLAVLTVMFEIGQGNIRNYHGLYELLNKLPAVRRYNTQTILQGRMTLQQFFGNVNTRIFYTYEGSLTTPPCSEAVTFIIFPGHISIPLTQISQFWNLLAADGSRLLRNYRPLQNLNGRPILFSAS